MKLKVRCLLLEIEMGSLLTCDSNQNQFTLDRSFSLFVLLPWSCATVSENLCVACLMVLWHFYSSLMDVVFETFSRWNILVFKVDFFSLSLVTAIWNVTSMTSEIVDNKLLYNWKVANQKLVCLLKNVRYEKEKLCLKVRRLWTVTPGIFYKLKIEFQRAYWNLNNPINHL